MDCQLAYIPERLHTKDRKPITQFFLNEHLYRRCSLEEKENPFAKISLVDLSVNRQGKTDESLSQPDDVLYNTAPTTATPEESFQNKAIVTLEILEMAENNIYTKKFVYADYNCTILLKHKPDPCNYAHAAFELYSNNVQATFENWKETLGSNAQKHLRTMCRQELAKMILKEEVRMNW